MASLKVICPKCLKGQQVVVDVPPGGIDHVCLLCKTSFRVRPPATPSSDDLPAPREAVPKPGDLPTPRGSLGTRADLPAPREAVPSPLDLPAPREAIPRASDLPVDRNAVPRPSDLPVDRNAVPRPSDLPVDRNAVPRPGDLPVDRHAVPRPGDLPVDRHAVPRPGDLPVDRNAVPRPGDLPVDRNAVARPILPPFAAPASTAPPAPAPGLPTRISERMPAKTPPLGLSLDLSLPQPPPAGPGESLTLGDPLAEPGGPPSLDLGMPPAAPVPSPFTRLPAGPPPLKAKAPPPVPRSAARVEGTAQPPPNKAGVDSTLPSLHAVAGGPALAPPPAAGEAKPPARPKPALAPLIPEPSEPPPNPSDAPERRASPAHRENLDLGFSLEFESSPRTSSGSSPVAIPFPAARVASEGMAEAAAESTSQVPQLSPPSPRSATAGRAMRPQARKAHLPRWVLFAGIGVAVAAIGAAVAVPLLRSAPNPDNVLKPLLPELAKDNLVAYQNAATALTSLAANFQDSGIPLRLKAAELRLIAAAAHGGGPNDAAQGEQAAASAASQPKLAPAVAQVRALVALVNGKPREVDKLLVDKTSPPAQLALGLARLAENKPAAAVAPLRGYVTARPDDLLGHYLLAQALADGPEARKELELVLGKNPAHPGAQIWLARLEATPEKRLAAARALADKKLAGAGPTEQATLELVIGQAHQALGRSLEAMNAYQKAVTLDRRLTAAQLALGEALLYDGKYAQALERLRGAGPALEATPAGKFALGAAYIAAQDAPKGLALVTAAAKEKPDDPRGPFWTGFAANMKQPPDFAAAEQGYRDAIKKDPRFLPAALRLAAILQQQDKAQDSLAVLRAAEEAGAPPPVLQLAWGEALIVAGEPAKAQEVFEKALESDPKSISALLGIASALEAQGKLGEAKVSLERTLKALPETVGLRERLASVCLKLGQKPEALAHYQAEIQAGHPTVAVRLAVARLALELDKVELAQSEAKKVLDVSPRNAEAAYFQARVYETRGSTGLALSEYRHATTWGNTPLFALHYGRLLDSLGKQQEALASLANAVSLPEARIARGRIYFRSGEVDNAIADFEAAVKMSPKDAEPFILLGMCHDKLGQADKSEAAWRAAIKIDANAPEPHYRLGRTEMDRARTASAIDHFNRALAHAPEKAAYLPDLTFQLAQAHLLSGAKALALANFKKYLEIAAPTAPARPEAERQVARLGGNAPSKDREVLDNQRLRKPKER